MRFLFLLFLGFAFSVSAQSTLSDPELTSYTWYLGGQWDSLVSHRKELVRSSGQDYFYLRYRIGEAAFRQQKYRIAIDEFQRASNLNSADTFSLKYLEAALRETGRAQEAVKIGKRLIRLGALPIPRYKKTSLNSVHVDFGTKISNSNAIGNLKYSSAGVNFLPHPSLALHASFSNVGQSNYYGLVKQLVYSGFLNWQGNKGFSIRSHFSYLDVSVTYNDNSQHFLQHQVGGLSARKSIENWDLDIGLDGGNMNYDDQIQETVGITWFPKSNSKLSLRYQVISQQQDGEQNWIHKPAIQIGIANTLWFGVEYYLGNTRNVIENNGFLLNNAYDKTQSRLMASLNWYPNRHFSAYLTATHEKRTETLEGFDYALNGIFFGMKLSPW